MILLLPVRTLWKLQVSKKRKLGLFVVIGFGACSVLISVLRLIVLYQFYSNPDFTYILGKMVIISSLELEVAIIAANLPSMRSVWIKHVTEGTLRSSKATAANAHSLEELGHKSTVSKGRGYTSPKRVSTVTAEMGNGTTLRSDSEEQLFDTKKITVTSSVGMSWADLPDGTKAVTKTYYQFDK